MSSDVSIAMAVYNGERFLRAQLDSLAAQTVSPCELVVTDDGSTDGTMAIVSDFARTAPFPVRAFTNEVRLNYRDNFIKAAGLCNGPLIAFCDQDDIWKTTKIETCAASFDDENVMLCIHSATVWHGGETYGFRLPDIKSHKKYGPLTLDPVHEYPGFAMVFRRDLLNITNNMQRPANIGWPLKADQTMSHDKWVWFLAAIFGSIVTISESLSLYRQHDSNMFGATAAPSLYEATRQRVRRRDFSKHAEHFLEYAGFLDRLSREISVDFRPAAVAAARKFRRRADLAAQRHCIYAGNANAVQRLQIFAYLLKCGGYVTDGFGAGFSLTSAVKDLCIGVPGLYKLFRLP